METRSRSKSSWRKILYEKQNFPDDYQSNDFLKDLKKNGKKLHYVRNIARYFEHLFQFVTIHYSKYMWLQVDYLKKYP